MLITSYNNTMPKIDELETTNPDEQELNSEEVVDETTDSNSDPLDDIQDETARKEAKKQRSIAQRLSKKPEPVVEKPKAEETEFVTKADMAKLATTKAKELASEEVQENWDNLLEIPLSGYDKLDAKSIAQNMEERLAIYKARNPAEDAPDTRDLTSTEVKQGTAEGKKSNKKENPLDKRIPKKANPDEWYSK